MENILTLDDVVSQLASQRFYWVQTSDDEGFWVKAGDEIGSYFERDIKMEIRKICRGILNRMGNSPSKPVDHQSTRNVNEVLNRLQEINTFHIEDFDADPHVIHFTNGLLFTEGDRCFIPRKGLTADQYEAIQNLQSDYSIKTFIMIPWNYPVVKLGDPEPDCPRFMKFLNLAIPKQIPMMWEWLGYLLLPTTRMKKSVFMVGDTDTGKTTLVKILRYILGLENCTDESFHGLCSNAFSRANLIAKLLNYDDDVSGLKIKDPGEFKKLTGDERLRVEAKHKDAYYVYSTCKLMFSTNHIPYIENLDMATANRILLFFFQHQFTNEEKDPCFVENLVNDKKEMEGIIYKAVKALPALLNRKYFITMDTAHVMHYLRLAIDPVYMFLNLHCNGIIGKTRAMLKREPMDPADADYKDFVVPASMIYDAFTTWAAYTGKDTRDLVKSQNKFTGCLRVYGIMYSKDKADVNGKKETVETYHYIKLKDNFKESADMGFENESQEFGNLIPDYLQVAKEDDVNPIVPVGAEQEYLLQAEQESKRKKKDGLVEIQK